MLKLLRSSCVRVAFAGLVALAAVSTAKSQSTALSKQLDRLDVAVSGMGVITKGVSGDNLLGRPVTENASSTVGALVQVRYTKSPLVGFELNYSYARFSEQFSGSPFSSPSSVGTPFNVQAKVNEYTFGYVAHLRPLFGVLPFASVGVGTTAFTPTPLGGQGLPERARLSYYYSVGAEDLVTTHFGVRAQLRQVFYKAPDFDADYLTTNQHTFSTQPSVGVYIKF